MHIAHILVFFFYLYLTTQVLIQNDVYNIGEFQRNKIDNIISRRNINNTLFPNMSFYITLASYVATDIKFIYGGNLMP